MKGEENVKGEGKHVYMYVPIVSTIFMTIPSLLTSASLLALVTLTDPSPSVNINCLISFTPAIVLHRDDLPAPDVPTTNTLTIALIAILIILCDVCYVVMYVVVYIVTKVVIYIVICVVICIVIYIVIYILIYIVYSSITTLVELYLVLHFDGVINV